jgi:hypothetical protein
MKKIEIKNVFIAIVLNILLFFAVYLLNLNFFLGIIFLYPVYIVIYVVTLMFYFKNIKKHFSWLILVSVFLGVIALFFHGYLQGMLIDYADFNKSVPNSINILSSLLAVLMWSLPLNSIILTTIENKKLEKRSSTKLENK